MKSKQHFLKHSARLNLCHNIRLNRYLILSNFSTKNKKKNCNGTRKTRGLGNRSSGRVRKQRVELFLLPRIEGRNEWLAGYRSSSTTRPDSVHAPHFVYIIFSCIFCRLYILLNDFLFWGLLCKVLKAPSPYYNSLCQSLFQLLWVAGGVKGIRVCVRVCGCVA